MGPVFGIKGGAAGGYAHGSCRWSTSTSTSPVTSRRVTRANNLLAAPIDNHVHHGSALDIDPRTITWKRVVDPQRPGPAVVVGPVARSAGSPARMVSTSSWPEVMAIFCLATSIKDLRDRLGRIVVGYTEAKKPVRAADLKAHGPMAVILRDALAPNLVQTLEAHTGLIMADPSRTSRTVQLGHRDDGGAQIG